MSSRKVALSALLMVSACSGNPLLPDDGTDPDGNGATVVIPEALAMNVSGAAYDADAGTLQLALSGVDSTPLTATYTRYAKLDLPGYRAFKVQEDSLDRMYVALAAESPDGSVRAVTAGDGGQFGYSFGGGHFERFGGFDRPSISAGPGRGQVTYAGDYAAVTDLSAPGNPDVIPVPGGTPGAVIPDQPGRISGDIFMNVNFADNLVNGTIYNRVLVDAGLSLEDVILVPSDIADNGTFEGEATNVSSDTAQAITGSYGGVFGGRDSVAVAGLVHLDSFLDDVDEEDEFGVFVLTQCGQPNDAPICSSVEPN